MADDRLVLVLSSSSLDKLMPAAFLAAGAVEAGKQVNLFLLLGGVEAFRKGATSEASPEYVRLHDLAAQKGVPGYMDLLRTAKALGKLKVFACRMSLDLLGLRPEDLDDLVDEVANAGEFLGQSQQHLSFVG